MHFSSHPVLLMSITAGFATGYRTKLRSSVEMERLRFRGKEQAVQCFSSLERHKEVFWTIRKFFQQFLPASICTSQQMLATEVSPCRADASPFLVRLAASCWHPAVQMPFAVGVLRNNPSHRSQDTLCRSVGMLQLAVNK